MAAVWSLCPRVSPPPPPLSLLLPLLCFCVQACGSTDPRDSMYKDVLLPYAHSSSHSHRHVRDCQPVAHGNGSHESWPSSRHSGLPVAESMMFVTDVPSSKYVGGHMTVVLDPLRTVSVLEPGGPGGCGMNQRATVEEMAKAAGCLFAQNAGFFHTDTGECLGNVVSDGRMVKESGGVQNVQFGIRRDGTLVFGYLSEDEVMDQSNPFVQLVSGVVWLLRNGEVYINQSLKSECDKTQESGQLRTFVDVASARSAVGHDANGKLVLFLCEGQTGVRGMNLWEVADFMKKNGVINAVNLDGGGSSTFVMNGSVAGYPSDHCIPDSRWRCGRRVSTVLCVHPRRCQPPDCGGHGDCEDGRCVCRHGWQGDACDALLCQKSDCGDRGVCTADGCLCDAGWRGRNCSQECLPGFYGDGCNQTCVCANGGSCEPVHGRCSCRPGFHGDACEEECPLGFFGASCAQRCRCDDQCLCEPQTGSCNATLPQVNNTLHRAEQCVVRHIIRTWRREEQRYLTERSWVIITVTLASLLSVSLLIHFVHACRRLTAARLPERRDYSYVPLSDIGDAAAARADARDSGKGDFALDDSDSQDDVWSPSGTVIS
ncbi:N-acetylglucosamine-1-phosphodiester alpha-N-acetylglucosaminidase isoform X2 [Solea solea]|uniref:N-acetylglucosamine-1-phosphodiester alpha-N-acetylglucosaminidase isoform X2 n=1 Tax=Solea solea TaxID=90069 RepID=UPI00272A1E65|nr:N-acetylglucosamine-1-phosphodiester alpha-N-acetylglucosaminidase isoform X2 [Solea solea]